MKIAGKIMKSILIGVAALIALIIMLNWKTDFQFAKVNTCS